MAKKKKKLKMPKARDMAMGDKNISYVGDPFIVDGKTFDPAKEFPETYMRPEGAETFSMGGDADACGCASCMVLLLACSYENSLCSLLWLFVNLESNK